MGTHNKMPSVLHGLFGLAVLLGQDDQAELHARDATRQKTGNAPITTLRYFPENITSPRPENTGTCAITLFYTTALTRSTQIISTILYFNDHRGTQTPRYTNCIIALLFYVYWNFTKRRHSVRQVDEQMHRWTTNTLKIKRIQLEEVSKPVKW